MQVNDVTNPIAVKSKAPYFAALAGVLVATILWLWFIFETADGQPIAQVSAALTPTIEVPVFEPPSSELLLWKYPTGAFSNSVAPVAVGGTLYSVVMYASDGTDSCRAYHGGWCYELYAIDIETGKLKWVLPDYEYPLTVANGTVYSGWGGELHAVDASTQQVKWRFRTAAVTKQASYLTNDIEHAPTVKDGVVYFGSGNTLYALNAETWVEKWRSELAESISSSPAVSGDFVYVTSDYLKIASNSDVINHQGNLYAVSRESGRQQWMFETVSGDTQYASARNPIVASDGTLYFTTSSTGLDNRGYVHAFDGRTGKEIWKRMLGGWLTYHVSQVLLHGELLIAADIDGGLYALDRATGDERWRFASDESYSGTPVMSNGNIYITTVKGTILGMDAESGEMKAKHPTGKDLYLETALTEGRVYFVGRASDDIYLFGLPR